MELKAKRNEVLESRKGPVPSRPENISPNHTAPGVEEIRLRAYEIHVERGGVPGNELDDWLQAERELQRVERQKAPAFLIAGETE